MTVRPLHRLFSWLCLVAFLIGHGVTAPVAEAATPKSESGSSKSAGAAKKAKAKKSVKAKGRAMAKAKVKTPSKAKAKAKSKAKANKKFKARMHARGKRVEAKPADTVLRQSLASQGGAESNSRGPALHSVAALVIDQKTGEAMFSKNADAPASIASITKLMTAMVALDASLPLDEEITITEAEVDRLKGTGSRLPVGARLTRGELMHLALIASENRAAAALSRAYPGGREAFVAAMNRKAQALGMRDSQFVDGTGLNSQNRSTAVDLAKMVDAAYRYPLIRRISTTGEYDVGLPGKRVVKVRKDGRVRKVTREVTRHVAFHNTNALTRDEAWDIGISKTGYISEAGQCLVMQARIAERPVIIVLLDSWGKYSRIGDANRIRDWIERNGDRMASRTERNPV